MHHLTRNLGIILILALAVLASCKKDVSLKPDENQNSIPTTVDSTNFLKINQLQIIGSHNSYRIHTYQPIYDFVQSISFLLPSQYNPDGWDYTHAPFLEQFNTYKIRSVEIDIYNDPQGGNFYNRQGNVLISEPVESGIPELQPPGFKVLHIPDFDYMTHYYTFKAALQDIKDWSEAHPNHVPFIIHIESKEETVGSVIGGIVPNINVNFTQAVPFDAAAADALDAEIKSVFGENLDMLITPDDLRGNYSTLNEAVLNDNWPTLGEARGKIMMVMEGPCVPFYVSGHPSLQGRAIFVYANPGEPEAAFVLKNDAIPDETVISGLVQQGYFVRTRSDADTQEARTGDYSRMNAAFASGAQIISTDYYRPDPRYTTDPGWTDYHVSFPDSSMFRINPVTAPDKLHWGGLKE